MTRSRTLEDSDAIVNTHFYLETFTAACVAFKWLELHTHAGLRNHKASLSSKR